MAVQQRKRPTAALLVAALVLLATPALVVGGFLLVTTAQFDRLEQERGPRGKAILRYDAYKHAYASGVMAVLLGEDVANVAGELVELLEGNRCVEREKDLVNNREGRRMALALHAADPADWRPRFSVALFDALRQRRNDFAVLRGGDRRVVAACASD